MKTAKKAISLILTAVMVLTAIPWVARPLTLRAQAFDDCPKVYDTEYYYAPGTQFVYTTALYYSSNSNADAENNLIYRGYTPYGCDFNAGTGGKPDTFTHYEKMDFTERDWNTNHVTNNSTNSTINPWMITSSVEPPLTMIGA